MSTSCNQPDHVCSCGRSKRSRISRFLPLAVLIIILIAASCKPKPTEDYNRAALLEHAGNMIITDAYAQMNDMLSELSTETDSFINTPDSASLSGLRNALKSAWLAWEQCSIFEFGPAESRSLRASINTFPTDTTQIETNISTGSWDLALAANVAAKGFPALDYLLNGPRGTVTEFAGSQSRRDYLSALSDELKSLINGVNQEWSTGYLTEFTTNEGVDISSPTSMLVNQLNYDLELLKNARLGIPLGKKTLGTPQPSKTEAYYGGYSAELAETQMRAIRGLYHGTAFNGTDGYGFHEILQELDAAYNGGLLADTISARLDDAVSALGVLSDPLSDAVVNNAAPVDAAWVAVQKCVIVLKTDMPSVLGILITYQDNDGD